MGMIQQLLRSPQHAKNAVLRKSIRLEQQEHAILNDDMNAGLSENRRSVGLINRLQEAATTRMAKERFPDLEVDPPDTGSADMANDVHSDLGDRYAEYNYGNTATTMGLTSAATAGLLLAALAYWNSGKVSPEPTPAVPIAVQPAPVQPNPETPAVQPEIPEGFKIKLRVYPDGSQPVEVTNGNGTQVKPIEEP